MKNIVSLNFGNKIIPQFHSNPVKTCVKGIQDDITDVINQAQSLLEKVPGYSIGLFRPLDTKLFRVDNYNAFLRIGIPSHDETKIATGQVKNIFLEVRLCDNPQNKDQGYSRRIITASRKDIEEYLKNPQLKTNLEKLINKATELLDE